MWRNVYRCVCSRWVCGKSAYVGGRWDRVGLYSLVSCSQVPTAKLWGLVNFLVWVWCKTYFRKSWNFSSVKETCYTVASFPGLQNEAWEWDYLHPGGISSHRFQQPLWRCMSASATLHQPWWWFGSFFGGPHLSPSPPPLCLQGCAICWRRLGHHRIYSWLWREWLSIEEWYVEVCWDVDILTWCTIIYSNSQHADITTVCQVNLLQIIL